MTHESASGAHEVYMSQRYKPDNAANKAWMDFVAATSTAGHRAWWFAQDADPSKNYPGGFEGLEKSLEYIGKYIENSGGCSSPNLPKQPG